MIYLMTWLAYFFLLTLEDQDGCLESGLQCLTHLQKTIRYYTGVMENLCPSGEAEIPIIP